MSSASVSSSRSRRRRSQSPLARRPWTETEEEENLADGFPGTASHRGRNASSRRRTPSAHRRGSNGYDEYPANRSGDEGPHRRRSSLSSLHSHSSQASLGSTGDRITEAGGGDRKDRFSSSARTGGTSISSRDRRDRDQHHRERDLQHHSERDKRERGDPSSISAAERRAVYSRTREHRERRLLDHPRPKLQSSPAQLTTFDPSDDKCTTDPSVSNGRMTNPGLSLSRRGVTEEDSLSGYSSRSMSTREGRPRRDRAGGDSATLDHDENTSAYSSRSATGGRERPRRDRSGDHVTIDNEDSISAFSPRTASTVRDGRPRRDRSGGDLSSPLERNDATPVYSLRSTTGGRDARHRRDRSAEVTASPEYDDNASVFPARSSATRDGRSRRERNGSDASSFDHEDEIERIRELRARRLRGERGSERDQQQIRDRDDRSRLRHSLPEHEGSEPATTSPGPSYNRREREYRRGVERERDLGESSPPNPPSSRSLVTRKELEDAGLVRERPNRRGIRDLSPRPSPSPRLTQNVANNSPSQSSYQRSRRDEGSASSGRGEDMHQHSRSDYRRDRERERNRERDHPSYPSQDRVTEGSRYNSRRVRRGRESPSDVVLGVPVPRRKSLGHDAADGGARRDVVGDMPLAAMPSARTSGRVMGTLVDRNVVKCGTPGREESARTSSFSESDRTVGTQQIGRDRISARERDKERKLPGRSITGGEDFLAVAGERSRERRLPLRAKSADGDLLAMDLGRVRQNYGPGDIVIGTPEVTAIQPKHVEESEHRRQLRDEDGVGSRKAPSSRGLGRSRSGDTVSRLRERREAFREENTASGVQGQLNNQEGNSSRLSLGFERDASQNEGQECRNDADKTFHADMEPGICGGEAALTEMEASTSGIEGALQGPSSDGASDGNRKPSRRPDPSAGGSGLSDDADHGKWIERIRELEFSSDEEDEINHNEQWSVRVCVVSAVDLPLNIVPNIPLCPILKFGLVKIPPINLPGTDGDDEYPAELPEKHLLDKLGDRGISAVPTARVRATRHKILSKRDNGSVDFHQELRWDRVKHPMQAALCVELSAQGVRTPKNFQESPPSHHSVVLHPPSGAVNGSHGSGGIPIHHSGSSGNLRAIDGEPIRQVQRNPSGSDDETMSQAGGLRAFWRKATSRKAAELEAANAAAAVARMLVDQDVSLKEEGGEVKANSSRGTKGETSPISSTPPSMLVPTQRTKMILQSDYNVALRSPHGRQKQEMTKDVRLGSLVIPFTNLPLDRATNGNEAARVEQWYQLDRVEDCLINAQQPNSRRKKPSILLEISFSSRQVLDQSEDEMEVGDDEVSDGIGGSNYSKPVTRSNISFSRRASVQARCNENNEKPLEHLKVEDPVLEPGVIDFISVVGARDIGSQRNDDGSNGWVNSTPKCCVLEQFPRSDDFHRRQGRKVSLPNMVEWFCFPEGIRLWRGSGPPTHSDLNLKRFSASSPPNVASSVAAFDACLNCTTSLVWFVIASNSDEYGSKLVKTYGTVIRFYVPAPTGIDPTQGDFAESLWGMQEHEETTGCTKKQPVKRLWVPIGICLTSNLPIVGVMEAMLLRLCEELAFKIGGFRHSNDTIKLLDIHRNLMKLVLEFQKPIAGAVNCSIPFLTGERFLLALPPTTGLPALPHGHSVVSVCRLLGAEGMNFLLAAVLTECKILIHSSDLADVAMVAEVVTALAYPFGWSLPYIPILPVDMLEFVEAPLSYIVGLPSCSLKLVDPSALDDVVVVDLDNGFSSADYFEGRRNGVGSKTPIQLPATSSTNISMAVYRLLRAEVDVEEEFGGKYSAGQSLPRIDPESLAEREFRVTVAIQICGLLRGYQECIGPVFNRDKFLKIAPALFEEARDATGATTSLTHRCGSLGSSTHQKVVSPRSKRFLSLLLNTQNFHQLLESLEADDAAFFHEIMDTFDDSIGDSKPPRGSMESSSKTDRTLIQLTKTLQKAEDKIPTYRVESADQDALVDDGAYCDGDKLGFQGFGDSGCEELGSTPSSDATTDDAFSFTGQFLMKTDIGASQPKQSESHREDPASSEYRVKLEKNPWNYRNLLRIAETPGEGGAVNISEKVKLRDAIGERRYRAWKMTQDQKLVAEEDFRVISEDLNASKQGASLDLTSLLSSATDDTSEVLPESSLGDSSFRVSTLSPEQQRVLDAKNRDAIRRCLDKANGGIDRHYGRSVSDGTHSDPFVENGRDLMAEAEKSLRNPSAQRFLLSILAQRSRLENQRGGRHLRRQSALASQSSVSRLEQIAFDCLIRLSCAMLDACMEYREYEASYRLLTHTAGFIMVQPDELGDREHHTKQIISMTSRIGLHPIFADLGVWENVMLLHLQERRSEKKSRAEETFEPQSRDASEDDDAVEYEAAVATLYEMLGYGIPGEELSRFATRVSEDYGWFCDDRGKQLLMLARRISVRREQTDVGAAGDTGDIDMIRHGQDGVQSRAKNSGIYVDTDDANYVWNDIGWCHPAAPTSRTVARSEGSHSCDSAAEESDYMKRSPVTSLAAFGSAVIVTGGLDGSVFLAHSISCTARKKENEPSVHGIHLDWGSASRASAGSSSDGEYGVGAVSCLAAASGSGHHGTMKPSGKDVGGYATEGDILASMEGSRVVAGTTAGDLRVWSVKDVYASILLTRKGEESYGDPFSPGGNLGGGNAFTRLKFSLRGRALSGHRGGVTCIDVPSHVYRPDSLVTGGADGLIKLWSLRAPTGGRRMNQSSVAAEPDTASQQRSRGGDALNILNGHSGRIICIKTAWHGDRLLSGAADRTIRIWDLAGNSGKCLHTLNGHFGWVTKVQYWGPNTVVSASTDRSVALWDARVRSMPLFMLRHHHSPISDLLVGSRTDPFMVSAATDGTMATWDFRKLSETSNTIGVDSTVTKERKIHCRVVRDPVATMRHGPERGGELSSGSVLLSRGVLLPQNRFLSVGADAVVREWDIPTGEFLEETPSGHCDAISSFSSFGILDNPDSPSQNEGTITGSWDGTIRMRRIVRR